MKGLAERLMASGSEAIWALVLAENAAARRFYARLGAAEERDHRPGALLGRPVWDVVLRWPDLPALAEAARRAARPDTARSDEGA